MASKLDREVSSLVRKLRAIRKIEVPRAGSSALNKVAKKVRTRTVRGVARTAGLKSKTVRKRTYFRKSSVRTQKARLTVYTRPVSAISQFTPGRRAGLKIGRGTNRKGVRIAGRQLDSAFITVGKSGNTHVFRRRSGARYPIEVVKFSIQDESERVLPVVARRVMANDYVTELKRELRFRIDKYAT